MQRKQNIFFRMSEITGIIFLTETDESAFSDSDDEDIQSEERYIANILNSIIRINKLKYYRIKEL